MNISISAVSGDRKFTKSMVRHSESVDRLRNAAIDINIDGLAYDTLQIVFLDRAQDYLRAVGCKGDRLFQVEVATPDQAITDFGSETAFLAAIAKKLISALEASRLPVECREEIVCRISSIIGES